MKNLVIACFALLVVSGCKSQTVEAVVDAAPAVSASASADPVAVHAPVVVDAGTVAVADAAATDAAVDAH